MNENNSISTLSLAVLGLIAQKPHSGYDLRKVFSTTPLGHFSSSPGAIYPALKRIEKSGWV
ncbi:MAG: PadR family transcriptional regulator, partial [Planctomycetota bacterium]